MVDMEKLVRACNARTAGMVITIFVEVGGEPVAIFGTGTNITDIGLSVVELLSAESSPDDQHLATDAEEKFLLAAEALVVEGKSFYTALRDGWLLPQMRWGR